MIRYNSLKKPGETRYYVLKHVIYLGLRKKIFTYRVIITGHTLHINNESKHASGNI